MCSYLAYSLQDFRHPPALQLDMDIYKKSVRLAHAYQQEGCGMTRTKINDANPHT